MTARRLAGISGFLAVALGAFGAHALRDRLTPQALEWWHTGVLYHLVHAAALLATGRAEHGGRVASSGWCFAAGTVLFSGSLYAMALTDQRWLGAVTPIGGLAFLAGWALLAFSRAPRHGSCLCASLPLGALHGPRAAGAPLPAARGSA